MSNDKGKETEVMVKDKRFIAPTQRGVYYYSLVGYGWEGDKFISWRRFLCIRFRSWL